MPSRVRTVLILLLTIGLLGYFLRNADMSQVWAEIRRARPALLVGAVLITGLTYVLRALRWQYVLAPLGADPLLERISRHGYRLCRDLSAAGARRRSDPAAAARPARRPAGHRDLCHHHPRTADGYGDRAPALRRIRPDGRSCHDVGAPGAPGARQGRGTARGRRRRRRPDRRVRGRRPPGTARALGAAHRTGAAREAGEDGRDVRGDVYAGTRR